MIFNCAAFQPIHFQHITTNNISTFEKTLEICHILMFNLEEEIKKLQLELTCSIKSHSMGTNIAQTAEMDK